MKGRVEAVAVSSVFSTVRNDDELRAATIAREVLGEDVHVSISSEIGSMGLIERENATILNAALYLSLIHIYLVGAGYETWLNALLDCPAIE